MQQVTGTTALSRVFKWSILSFWRNRLLSIAATLVMTLTLLTISLFVILNLIIGTTVDVVQHKIDLVVYLTESATEADIANLKTQVEQMPEVASVNYIDKAQALAKWQSKEIKDELKNIATTADNPLPRSLEIKVKDLTKLEQTATFFESAEVKPLVDKTTMHENRATINRLLKTTRFFRISGIIFSAFFVLISLLVIFNTIRLAIYSRRDEIDIMKLVGATSSAIRWPFIVEGMFYGLLATVISVILLFVGFRFLSPVVNKYLGELMTEWGGSLMNYFIANLWQIILWQLLVGFAIGAACGFLAIRKHLKV